MEGSFHCSRNDLLPPKSQPTLASRPPPSALPVLGMYITSPSPIGHSSLKVSDKCMLSVSRDTFGLLLDSERISYALLKVPDHTECLRILTGMQNRMGLHCSGFSASQLKLDIQGEARDRHKIKLTRTFIKSNVKSLKQK